MRYPVSLPWDCATVCTSVTGSSWLMALFELESEEEIAVKTGGVNHFFWILELSINGKDSYRLLEQRPSYRDRSCRFDSNRISDYTSCRNEAQNVLALVRGRADEHQRALQRNHAFPEAG